MRCLRPDRMSFCLTQFIINMLGPRYVEPPVLDLKQAFEESLPQTPLIFVLSAGVDPTQALLTLADQVKMSSRMFSLSLGQGQAPVATKLIMDGVREGNWVFLANCHLSLSWMPTLDKIIATMQTMNLHRKFRLWLSSSPHPEFPISILQTSIKMTTEPPRGIKANMKRLYLMISEQNMEQCYDPGKYKKLLFALCFFHTLLLERKKFLQLGWNVIYSFNDSDFEVSEILLALYLNEYEETPWGALKYLIAGVNYGGHVTDDWDRRLLTTYINQFYCDDAIKIMKYRYGVLDIIYWKFYLFFNFLIVYPLYPIISYPMRVICNPTLIKLLSCPILINLKLLVNIPMLILLLLLVKLAVFLKLWSPCRCKHPPQWVKARKAKYCVLPMSLP